MAFSVIVKTDCETDGSFHSTRCVISTGHTYLVSCTVEHCCSLTVVHSFSYEVEHS